MALNINKIIFISLSIIVLIFLLVVLSSLLSRFIAKLKYINMEIKRTDGEEKRKWKKLRRKLWMGIIFPF